MTFLRYAPRLSSPSLSQSTRLTPHSRRVLSTTHDAPSPFALGSTEDPLAGTAPSHHLYAFLHTPHPPGTYPAKFATPVQRRLLMATMPYGGSVNFAWSGSGSGAAGTGTGTGTGTGDASGVGTGAEDTYRLTAFSSARGKLEIDQVSLANVDKVGRLLQAHIEPPSASSSSTPSLTINDSIHLYICTHGARDCRCGTTGGAVAGAIRAELRKRHEANPSDLSTCIELAEVAHVGGHKYAANVLVYPHGEWLGRVKPEDVPEIINAILERPIRPMHPEEMPICPSYWRGRMGLNKEQQMDLLKQWASQSDD